MPKALQNIIVGATPNPADLTVALRWANGRETVKDLRGIVEKGVFSALANPDVFALVRVGARGRSLEWPGEIDFCADALWFETHPEELTSQRQSVAA
jgi:hypothetical protein